MVDSSVKVQQVALSEVSDDDEEVALVTTVEEEEGAEASTGVRTKSDEQASGVVVLALLDKIIGVVDQIQQTQGGLEARQQDMERSVSGIQSELAKLSKSHAATAHTVGKMLDKVRKVNVNVKTVRADLEKQAGQIKKLENNENELLKRRNFKVLIYQDVKTSPKVDDSQPKEGAEGAEVAEVEGKLGPEEGAEEPCDGVSSDEEVVIEEIIEESRAERIKRSGLQRMDDIKKAFSKEKMEKTRQRTREKMEKTRQRTRENIEKTKHTLEKKMSKLSTRVATKADRKEKMKSSREKGKKSRARSKTYVYRVPPFTFHVKKIREGAPEVHNPEEEEEEEEEPVEAEEGADSTELLGKGGTDVQALIDVAEDSKLVLVEQDGRGERK
ncbi:polymerase I and transcript release factor-like [Scleropages formosus]|uniref:Caveolae associated protein 1 n=1 Tax=Scleropages formosus TaxID=113540 RepID=A0A0P7XPW5_SCLFO|nr:caveolae-associated protein 1-like [Scleropages formosus]KPP78956.1 polymerase I and transcript release factor-like [Scleropages formosus]